MEFSEFVISVGLALALVYDRGERDFRFWDRDWDLGGISLGLEAWDQTIKSWVSVSMIETTDQKSLYQSQSLRPGTKSLSLSHKN
jgi:hypothetical protein